jgi:hypothetical protein
MIAAKNQENAQEPTRGFVIELASHGKSYEYHSDLNHVVTCPESEKQGRTPKN